MTNYIGIDLGTTNSAICSYDGTDTRIWKSPEQNDVTPSAIYIDKRGNKYIGKRAYDSAPHSPGNAVTLFKRLMGTTTPVEFSALGLTKTPEECSSEVLKALFGYLPEELRDDPETGTVITVPAAFSQMQKDATMQAASMAGLGNVALMQEPVAAVMSVMRTRKADGIFLIYDLGGGTLDVALAESIGGRVNLLSHGGIAMCGGRDFDRLLVDNVVRPWLLEQFDLPDDFAVNPSFRPLLRLAHWATERAKIELSANDDAVISLSEAEARARDLKGEEIYLDIPLDRATFDGLIAQRVDETIAAAREALSKAGFGPHDLDRIVFVGGPTHYKHLREKVSFELGIPGNTDVNPMTAVAEGASLYAESIDWGSQSRSRKSTRGQVRAGADLSVSFNYVSRTPDTKAKIGVQVTGNVSPGSEFQVDSIDTGWTSGRLPLEHGRTLDLPLSRPGPNKFKVFLLDPSGSPIRLENDRVTITRTAATVDSIPASHSIGLEMQRKVGGRPVLEKLIQAGDPLPRKGGLVVKAAETLKAGTAGSINLKVWEGEIEDPIEDNRFVGVMQIKGTDLDSGVIPAGAELHVDYEMLDSGNLIFEVSVPCIGSSFHSGRNFYSREAAGIDYTAASAIALDEGERALRRIDEVAAAVDDPSLEEARRKAQVAAELNEGNAESEKVQEAMEGIQTAKKLLAQVRKEHIATIRTLDLERVTRFFNEYVREHARPSDITSFESLVKTAQREISIPGSDFEHHLDELRQKNFDILWRQDWFVVQRFKWMVESPHLFVDKARFEELAKQGAASLQEDDIAKLRAVVAELSAIQVGGSTEQDMSAIANIIKG